MGHPLSVGIIGGADGPTAVYLGGYLGAEWRSLLPVLCILHAVLLSLSVFGLVRGIRKRRWLRTGLCALLCVALVLLAVCTVRYLVAVDAFIDAFIESDF